MGAKLRVFISSTMEDLQNERSIVCEKLREFNFEPVVAEEMYPNSTNSWDKVSSEVAGSDVFVLILGKSYGWIPKDGAMCEHDKSVTHLEYEKARELDIPVLLFTKKLTENEARDNSAQATRRREFKSEVENWKGGFFKRDFNLAKDLADSVGAALVSFLTEKYRNGIVLSDKKHDVTNKIPFTSSQSELISLPTDLVHSVVTGETVLFVGAGMSLDAGFPSAMVFAQMLKNEIRDKLGDAHYASLAGADFFGVATDIEANLGRKVLEHAVANALPLPAKGETSPAHDLAIKLFDRILTTNFDMLLNESNKRFNAHFDFITGENEGELPQKCVVKLHGCVDEPDSLLLTESQVYNFDTIKPVVWDNVVNLLSTKKVLVVGSSIRDPSIIRLFSKAGEKLSGYYISPVKDEFVESRMRLWNLECIQATAEKFMVRLEKDVSATNALLKKCQ